MSMLEPLLNLLYLCSRYVHIVATTVLVGGTLFYEWVVPLAIGEMREEVQLALFGRMRWAFRWIVYTCALVLIVSGCISTYRNWYVYNGKFSETLAQVTSQESVRAFERSSPLNRPRWWFVTHVGLSMLGLVIGVALVSGGSPPNRPIQWMRINLILLLLAIFLASGTRDARQRLFDVLRWGEPVPSARD
jgi:hypothetical protein